jgi:hypothetical protein
MTECKNCFSTYDLKNGYSENFCSFKCLKDFNKENFEKYNQQFYIVILFKKI